jgi:hypothetical protein
MSSLYGEANSREICLAIKSILCNIDFDVSLCLILLIITNQTFDVIVAKF